MLGAPREPPQKRQRTQERHFSTGPQEDIHELLLTINLARAKRVKLGNSSVIIGLEQFVNSVLSQRISVDSIEFALK